jgi:hypothetical protein
VLLEANQMIIRRFPRSPPSDLFHELTHSTGHQKRLARESILEAAPCGSAVYSKEELCAETGAAYLCAEAGISNAVIGNQVAYVAGAGFENGKLGIFLIITRKT